MVQIREMRVKPAGSTTVERLARWSIFIYIDLWVLEGALRKWVPALSDVGYFARDGFILAAIVMLMIPRFKTRRSGLWFWALALILFVWGAIQVIIGQITLPIMLVGFRSYIAIALLPLLIWQYRAAISLEQFSRRILIHLPLQAALVVVQVLSPPNAPINWTVGEESAGFVNFGVVRSTGTFSAVSGLGAYLGIVVAVSLVGLLSKNERYARTSLISAAICLMCAGLGGDRSTLLTAALVVASFLFCVLVAGSRGRAAGVSNRLLGFFALAGAGLVVVLTQFTSIFDSFSARFASAAQSEDSTERLLRQTFEFSGLFPSDSAPNLHLIGDGMAAHTQAGIALGSTFEWVEIEATRWVAELGILGLVLGWARIALALALVIQSVHHLREGSPALPTFSILLISVLLPGLVTQTPSTQGAFGVMLVLIMLTWRKGPQPANFSQPVRADEASSAQQAVRG